MARTATKRGKKARKKSEEVEDLEENEIEEEVDEQDEDDGESEEEEDDIPGGGDEEIEDAVAIFRVLASDDPKALHDVLLAGLRAKSGAGDCLRTCDLLDALTVADGASEKNPADLAQRAVALLNAGRAKEAVAVAEEASDLQEEPTAEMTALLVECCLAAGDPQGARAAAKHLRTVSENSSAQNEWSQVRTTLGIGDRHSKGGANQ